MIFSGCQNLQGSQKVMLRSSRTWGTIGCFRCMLEWRKNAGLPTPNDLSLVVPPWETSRLQDPGGQTSRKKGRSESRIGPVSMAWMTSDSYQGWLWHTSAKKWVTHVPNHVAPESQLLVHLELQPFCASCFCAKKLMELQLTNQLKSLAK